MTSNISRTLTFIAFVVLLIDFQRNVLAKVVDFGDKLPQFVRENPNTGWLVKFYIPACSKCHQIEPTYLNVAESIYHAHDDLVVGRVDCAVFGAICDSYSIDEYPKIVFLKNDSRYAYRGDAIASSIIEFSERLNGPKIRLLRNCSEVLELTETKDPIVLGVFPSLDTKRTTTTPESNLLDAYKAAVKSGLTSSYWFYGIQRHCPEFERPDSKLNIEALMVFKRGISKPTTIFRQQPLLDDSKSTLSSTSGGSEANDKLTQDVIAWIKTEAFPIFGYYSRSNINTALASGKHIILALLDEFKPARKLLPPSNSFKPTIAQMAKEYARFDNKLIFGWSTDMDFIDELAGRFVRPLPNILFLRSDLTFCQLHIAPADTEVSKSYADMSKALLPRELSQLSIRKFIGVAKSGVILFEGGNMLTMRIWRKLFRLYRTVQQMFKANRELMMVLSVMCTAVSGVLGYAFMHPPNGYVQLGGKTESSGSGELSGDDGSDEAVVSAKNIAEKSQVEKKQHQQQQVSRNPSPITTTK